MLAALLGSFWPYVVTAVGAVALWFGNSARQRAKGREQVEQDALLDTMKRKDKGHEAANDLRDADHDELVDSLRRNEGRWN